MKRTLPANELRKYLQEIRWEGGESIKDMADKLGIRPADLSAIEDGRKQMPEGFLERIQTIYMVGE